jgi:hypothetical protein
MRIREILAYRLAYSEYEIDLHAHTRETCIQTCIETTNDYKKYLHAHASETCIQTNDVYRDYKRYLHSISDYKSFCIQTTRDTCIVSLECRCACDCKRYLHAHTQRYLHAHTQTTDLYTDYKSYLHAHAHMHTCTQIYTYIHT